MKNIDEMKKRRGQICDSMNDMLKQIDNFSAEQTKKFDDLSNEFDQLGKDIERAERVEEMNNNLKGFKATNRPNVTPGKAGSKYGSEDYENNFNQYVTSKGKVQNALEEGTDSEGGFVVGESWESTLDRYLEDENVMRQVATVVNYNSDRNIPLTTSNGSATWVDEEGGYGNNDIVFANKKLQAFKLGNIIKVSEELLYDSIVNLQNEIGLAYGESFGTVEETAFTSGDGSGKPTGFLTDASSGKTAASATAVTYDELVDLLYSVRDVYIRNGNFMMNRTTASIVRKLKSSDGVPLWQPNLQTGQPNMLLGIGARINEQMPAMTTGLTPIAVGDFKKYRIADRVGMVMQVLNELYAANGQIGFKIHKRTDGKLVRTEAIKYLTMA